MVRLLKRLKSDLGRFTFKNKLKLALLNFLDRRVRNFMIASATSIGFIGISISLGLGNAIVDMIDSETDNGNLPAQLQISLNNQSTGGGVLNQSDIHYLEKLVGKDKIKYLESPFSTLMQSVSIDGKSIDLSTTLPNYAQIVSLYENTSIKVSANDLDDILSGSPYKKSNENGLTIPETLVDDFNQKNGTSYTAKNILGEEVELVILENTEQGNRIAKFKTTIIRVLGDELRDSNSFMAPKALGNLLEENQFNRNRPYLILELNNPEDTERVAEKIKSNNKYTVLSQQEVLGLVLQFIRVIQGLLIVLSSQAVLVSAVMIGVIIYINIIQRSKEIGVMKTVGYLDKHVKSIFIYESLLITFLALFVALVISQVLGFVANTIISQYYPSITRVFYLNINSILFMLCLAGVLGYGSAYFPTRKISKLDPVESLRHE